MTHYELDLREAAARRAGNWNEVKRLQDLRRQLVKATGQNSRQRAGASDRGGFHENHHGFNASYDLRR